MSESPQNPLRVEFTYEQTPALLRRGRRFCRYLRMGKTGGMLAFAGAAIFGAAYLFLYLVNDATTRLNLWVAFYSAAIVACGLVLVLANSLVLRSRCAFALLGPVHIQITDTHLSLTAPGGAATFPWDRIMGFEESPTLWLLLTMDSFLVIPQTAIPSCQQEPLRRFILAKIAPRRPTFAFPVQVPPATSPVIPAPPPDRL